MDRNWNADNIFVCSHIASECTSKALMLDCWESGHMVTNCPNEGICMSFTRQGHIAANCTNGMASKNCRRTGRIAHDFVNEPVCNLFNITANLARQCPWGDFGRWGEVALWRRVLWGFRAGDTWHSSFLWVRFTDGAPPEVLSFHKSNTNLFWGFQFTC